MKTGVPLLLIIFTLTASAGSLEQAHDLAIDAKTILDAYDENEVTADAKYLNKRVSIGGVVDRVAKDNDGDPFVLLGAAPTRFVSGRSSVSSQHIRCKFLRSSFEKVASLRTGTLIAVHGVVAGRPRRPTSPAEIVLSDCTL
jgi:putative nucleic acid binding protein